MAITLVQSTTTGATHPANLAYGSNNAAGNLLILLMFDVGATSATAPTDTQSNSWITVSSGGVFGLYYAANSKAGANTVTPNSVASTSRYSIYEFSGCKTSSVLDQSNTAGWTASITPTANGCLIFASADNVDGSSYKTITPSAGWTAGQIQQYQSAFPNFYEDQDGWQIQTNAAAINVNAWSAGGASGGKDSSVIASFFAAPAAAGGVSSLLLTGVGS